LLDGPPPTEPFELFATVGARPAHFDGHVLRIVTSEVPTDTQGAWVAPGEALFVSSAWTRIGHYAGGLIRFESLGGAVTPTKITAVALIEAGHPVVAARINPQELDFYRYDQGAWSILVQAQIDEISEVRRMIPYQGGFIYSGDLGTLGFYSLFTGLCPLPSIGGHHALVALDNARILVGGDLNNDRSHLYRLTPR
jgi:hypothetical protein